MPGESRIGTVVLTVQYDTRSSYYLDWLEAFECSPLFAATTFNLFRRDQRRAAIRAVSEAELVVALHACSADTLDYIKPLRTALANRRGRLLILVGNEYNLPWTRLGEKRDFLREVAADYVGTQLPIEAGEWLYAGTGTTVLALPHALNETVFRPDKPDPSRPIDIGGRSARYPAFIGDDERNRVHDLFAQVGPSVGLRVDVDTGSRLDRSGWAMFLNDCRGTIGTEAGSWYLERDDRTVLEIRDFLRARTGPGAISADGPFHALSRRLPYRVKTWLRTLLTISPIRHEAIDNGDVNFAEIEARFFLRRPRCPVYSKCISSRHFDAAGTGTCQILLRGRYNDILAADEHYIALDPDLANADEAIARFRDPAERRRIAAAALSLVKERHTYRHRMAALHEALCRSEAGDADTKGHDAA
jgi:spore maturation protein CgeB